MSSKQYLNRLFSSSVLSVAEECKVVCLDSICVDTKAIVTLSLAELPQNPGRFALVLGGLDNKVKLYCGERTGKVLPDSLLCLYIL